MSNEVNPLQSTDGVSGGKKLENFPIALFASVMGLAGLAIAWHKTHEELAITGIVSDRLRYFATAVWLILAAIYLFKGLRFPQQIKADNMHPVKMNFITTISIGLLLLPVAWKPASPTISQSLWLIGTLSHLGLTFFIINRWIFKTQFKLPQITAAWFIPEVGNIIVPVAGINYAPAM